ncbi:MAG: DUF4396 domain-containing protein [Bryobacteraceae bacterium]
MAPSWLTLMAVIHLMVSGVSALIVTGDILAGHRQNMAVMNLVWPITALWAGPLGFAAYWFLGRQSADNPGKKDKPFWQSVLIGDCHCGAGCTVGDFAGEWLVYLTGVTIAGSVLWADYLFDFVLAYLVGIAFQYYSIAPMRSLSGWDGIKAALKADTISLLAFEIGMFAWMAFSSQVLFHPKLQPTEPAYWYMMQIAMLVGFITAYPANWWLIRKRLKEAM